MNTIVPTNVEYNSLILKQNLFKLKEVFPFLQITTIGTSVLNDNIYCVQLGKGKKEIFYSASIHSNEWITSVLLMKFIEDYCNSFVDNINLYGYSIKNLFESTTIYIVPMINPDGVNLVTNYLSKNSNSYKFAKNIANQFNDIPFPNGWKANINGVDLNLQFPAMWEKAKEIKYNQGFNRPAPRDFPGPKPLSEPESIALYNFTLFHNFNLILSYHTQGGEIYFNFQNITPKKSWYISNQFSKASHYLASNVPYNSSFAGYKDWFISQYDKPGFTIEAGYGTNPLPISQFDKIYKDNLGILILGATLN